VLSGLQLFPRVKLRWRELWTFLKLVCILGLTTVWCLPIVFPVILSYLLASFSVSIAWGAWVWIILLLLLGGPVAFVGSIILLFVPLSVENRGIVGLFVFVGSIGPLVFGLLLLTYHS
jgi:hypothetical protein